jgi:hypothetical protein
VLFVLAIVELQERDLLYLRLIRKEGLDGDSFLRVAPFLTAILDLACESCLN